MVYSCPGFILLGMMLERIAGTPLDRLFGDRVLHPLGLEEQLGFRPEADRPLAGGAVSPDTELRLVAERGLDPATIPPVGPALPDDGNARFLGGVAGNAGLFGTAAGVLGHGKGVSRGRCVSDRPRARPGHHRPHARPGTGSGSGMATRALAGVFRGARPGAHGLRSHRFHRHVGVGGSDPGSRHGPPGQSGPSRTPRHRPPPPQAPLPSTRGRADLPSDVGMPTSIHSTADRANRPRFAEW